MLYVDCSVKRQTSWGCLRFVIVVFPDHTLTIFAPKWSISYFQPVLAAVFVTIATVKVKLLPDLYTWVIVLINP